MVDAKNARTDTSYHKKINAKDFPMAASNLAHPLMHALNAARGFISLKKESARLYQTIHYVENS